MGWLCVWEEGGGWAGGRRGGKDVACVTLGTGCFPDGVRGFSFGWSTVRRFSDAGAQKTLSAHRGLSDGRLACVFPAHIKVSREITLLGAGSRDQS